MTITHRSRWPKSEREPKEESHGCLVAVGINKETSLLRWLLTEVSWTHNMTHTTCFIQINYVISLVSQPYTRGLRNLWPMGHILLGKRLNPVSESLIWHGAEWGLGGAQLHWATQPLCSPLCCCLTPALVLTAEFVLSAAVKDRDQR